MEETVRQIAVLNEHLTYLTSDRDAEPRETARMTAVVKNSIEARSRYLESAQKLQNLMLIKSDVVKAPSVFEVEERNENGTKKSVYFFSGLLKYPISPSDLTLGKDGIYRYEGAFARGFVEQAEAQDLYEYGIYNDHIKHGFSPLERLRFEDRSYTLLGPNLQIVNATLGKKAGQRINIYAGTPMQDSEKLPVGRLLWVQ